MDGAAVNIQRFDGITAQVKLVIWDLDETFWKGTLSEEGIVPVAAHIDMIRTLVDRGIMCAICSKNDFDQARAAVEELGIWDLFVFPHIAWSPKGQAIQKMIADMGLRAENVLFLDDNHLNLEEAQFFNDGLMVLEANVQDGADMTGLLDLPQLAGKDDTKHSRLKQYKVMEQKQSEQAEAGLSNVDFLRQSQIKLRIISDVENHMDRVLELLNRTNQLNFTKIRANTDEERAALEELLSATGMHAGLIEVRDRYGDYGIVGFFCIRLRYNGVEMKHFAFSCRTLNMGVEQWVWNHLGRPEFEPAKPVASALDDPAEVDWITEVQDFDSEGAANPDRRFLLVGGCDLQQVSFYCSTNRDEFVNTQGDDGMLVRYDDVGVFINPRDRALQNAQGLKFAGYTLEDMQRLDIALAEADQILLSMYFSSDGDNLFTFGGREGQHRYWCTIPPARLRALMRNERQALTFAKTMVHRRLPPEDRMKLTRAAFEHAARLKKPDAPLFILGATTDHGPQAERSGENRRAFNAMCRAFCADTPGAVFIDTNTLLTPDQFNDSDHYTRTGYYAIAEFLNTHTPDPAPTGKIPEASGPVTAPVPLMPAMEAVKTDDPAPPPAPKTPVLEPVSEPEAADTAEAPALEEGQIIVDADDVGPRWLADLRRSDHRCGFYHSDETFAAQFTDRGNRVLMMSFDNLSNVKDPALSREAWGYSFYRDEGWSHFGVMSFVTNWYRDEALFDYLSNLANAGFFDAFDRVVLTGTSMGAYASTAFCSLIPGSVVLAFSPQSTLDTTLVPWEERFGAGRKQDWSGRFRDGGEEIAGAGEAYILYDPYFEPDRKHADRLQGDHVHHLKTWFAGHKSALFLRRAEILKPIVRAAVDGSLSGGTFYQLYRARRKLPWYVNGLADVALDRGHEALVGQMAKAVARDGREKLGQAIENRMQRRREG